MLIHYIWIDFKNEMNQNPKISERFITRIKKCIEVNEGCTFKIWNGYECRKLLQDNYPEYLKLYDSLKAPIMRCDMIRYFILYHYGGIYMDCDRICQKNIIELIDKYKDIDVLIPRNILFFISNDFIYAKQGSDFMMYCIKNIKTYNMLPYFWNVLLTAGPAFLLWCYYTYKGNEKIKSIREISACNISECSVDIAYKYQYEDMSQSDWHRKNEIYVFDILVKYYKEIIIVLLLIGMIYYKLNFKKCKKSKGCKF